jgi:hypothetical protein
VSSQPHAYRPRASVRRTFARASGGLTRAALARSCFVLLTVAGCSSLFGIDVPPLIRGATAGTGVNDAGAAGAVPSELGGTGAADQGLGGGPASVNGGATAMFAGGRGGSAGRADAEAGGGNDASGGDGASETTSGGIVKLGTPCDRPGALACPGAVASFWLICDGGRWQEGGVCGQDEHCDERNGTCGKGGIPTCDKYGPKTDYCAADPAGGFDNLTCGLDTVNVEVQKCPFECKDGVGCLPPSGDELALEPESPVATDRVFWPGPTIPVCVTNPDEPAWDWIDDEVGITWGRYGGIAFAGWNGCDANAVGVVATLLTDSEPCQGWLGAVDHVGYPGPNGRVNLSICTSYYDAAGTQTIATPDLVRLVARHEFGHVLGFNDAAAPNSDDDFMARGIRTGELSQYGFGPLAIGMLTEAYGRKPAGALLDEHGDCLSVRDGALAFASCDGSAAQTFAFVRGALAHPSTGDCIVATTSAGASAAACSSTPDAANQGWQPLEAQIRGFGGDCLQLDASADGQGGAGPGLAMDACPDLRTRNGVWTVEFVDGGARIRLRELGTTDCVTADPSTLALSLDACDDCAETDPACGTQDRFSVNDAGQIRQASECLHVRDSGSGHAQVPDTGPVELAPCSLAPSMLWNLSGRIESSTGTALTYPTSAGTLAFGARTIGQGAFDNQIFDFYFSESTLKDSLP